MKVFTVDNQAEKEIQARHRVEKELVKSKERLVAAQRLAKMGDFRWDLETGEISWSDTLFDLLGYETSENFDVERVNAQVHHPDDLEQIIKWLNTEIASDRDTLTPNEYRLVCRDGSGMDKDTLEQIFEPFFTTKDESKGTGLGLATVYGIVKQNDGFVTVHSEPEKGTCFKIFLPRHGDLVDKEMDQETARIPQGKGETVLLVEDDPPVLKLARTVLATLGYKVVTAATPKEALAQAKTYPEKIHMMLTDVVMPEMNGRQLAEQLVLLRPDTKILYMSGYSTDVITETGVLEKGTAFMNKPFAVRDMAVKVREVLDDRV